MSEKKKSAAERLRLRVLPRVRLNLSMARTAEKVYHALEEYSLLRVYKAREIIKLYSNAFKWLQILVAEKCGCGAMDAYLARLGPISSGAVAAVHHFECAMARGDRADERDEAANEAIESLRRGIDFMKGEYEKVFGEQLE